MADTTIDDRELSSELDFLKAADEYRRAKSSGDPEATRKAEEAWRAQVRRELECL